MAAAAAAAGDSALPPWILAHGIHDLGIAHFAHLKVRNSGSFIRVGYIYVRLPAWIDSTWGLEGGVRVCFLSDGRSDAGAEDGGRDDRWHASA